METLSIRRRANYTESRTPPTPRGERFRGKPPGGNRQIHGERVLEAAWAHMLWELLGEPNHRGETGSEAGVVAEVIETTRRGREYAKLAIGVNTTRAYEYWRSQTRSTARHGGNVGDLYGEYYDSVSAYRRRHVTLSVSK